MTDESKIRFTQPAQTDKDGKPIVSFQQADPLTLHPTKPACPALRIESRGEIGPVDPDERIHLTSEDDIRRDLRRQQVETERRAAWDRFMGARLALSTGNPDIPGWSPDFCAAETDIALAERDKRWPLEGE